MKNHRLLLLPLVLVFAAGCVCVSSEQAVNISELHDGVVRLMPFAAAGVRAEIAAQTSISNDMTKTQAERDAAATKVTELQGRLLETKLLPSVSEPIRDWAVAKVGTESYSKAKADRDARVAGGH